MPGHTLRHSNTSPLVMLNASFALGGLRSPDHYVRNEICIGSFPHKRRTTGKAHGFFIAKVVNRRALTGNTSGVAVPADPAF